MFANRLNNVPGARAGTATGIGAGLIWGVAFLLPEMVAAGSLELTMMRYLVYGLVSVGLLAWRWTRIRTWLDRALWRTALLFAVTGNLGYYLFVVLGIRLVGAPATVTIIGSLPVTVAVVGNWRRGDFAFRQLALPLLLVLTGLTFVNGIELLSGVARPEAALAERGLGLACAGTALALWTSYGVQNAELLRRHPTINSADWSTVVGAASLVLALMSTPLALAIKSVEIGDPGAFLVAAVVLGLIVSWGGTLLWNHASSRLPAAVTGVLVTVETLSGILYVSAYTLTVPSALQLVGLGLVVLGVVQVVRLPGRGGSAPDATRPSTP